MLIDSISDLVLIMAVFIIFAAVLIMGMLTVVDACRATLAELNDIKELVFYKERYLDHWKALQGANKGIWRLRQKLKAKDQEIDALKSFIKGPPVDKEFDERFSEIINGYIHRKDEAKRLDRVVSKLPLIVKGKINDN